MIEEGAADAFVADWIAAWNARDLDKVAAHYADEVVYYSPRIEAVTGRADPCLIGKPALEAFWRKALEDAPEINFVLDRVYIGSRSLTITYRNHRGQNAAQTLVFDNHGRVNLAVVTYR